MSELRRARQAAGLTIEQLAVRAGIGGATVERIENGRTRPTKATLAALTGALGVAEEVRNGDAQLAVTHRTLARLKSLEARVAELEARLADAPRP